MQKTLVDADAGAAIALRALGFLAQDASRFSRFLALTGLELEAIRGLAVDRGFQSAVLEHLMADEKLLLEFCASEALDPTLPAAAQRVLASSNERASERRTPFGILRSIS